MSGKWKPKAFKFLCGVDDCQNELIVRIDPADPSMGIDSDGIDEVEGCNQHYPSPITRLQYEALWGRVVDAQYELALARGEEEWESRRDRQEWDESNVSE